MTRLFITSYKCVGCDYVADRPSAFVAHYRDEHNTEVTFTLPEAEPSEETP